MFIQKAAGVYTKTHKMCTIYDGHAHVERRVYAKEGREYVRLNGYFFAVTELMTDFHYEVDIWY